MLTPEEIEEAKSQLAAMIAKQEASRLSVEDYELMKKYPRHTLAAARLIDSVSSPRPPLGDHGIHEAGQDFQYLQWQESGMPYGRQ